MCEEESDDSEAVAKLLEINDSIHRTIERYKLVKKGDLDAASKIPKGTLGTLTGVSKTADNELSLIDFGVDTEPSAAPSASQNASRQSNSEPLEDDLLGISFQDRDYGQGGGIALAFGANISEWLLANLSTELLADAEGTRCTWTIIAIILHPTEFGESPNAQHHPQAFTKLCNHQA